MWHDVVLQKSYTATDHRKLFGYEMWQRAENKDFMAPTETTISSVRKVLSDTFPCHLLSLLYLFLFLTLLLFKTHTVSRWRRSWNNPWNSALHVVFSGGPGIYSKTTDHNLIPWLNSSSFLRTNKATRICYWAPRWVPLLLREWAGLPRRRASQPAPCSAAQLMLWFFSSSWMCLEWDRRQLQWESSSSCSHCLSQELLFCQG